MYGPELAFWPQGPDPRSTSKVVKVKLTRSPSSTCKTQLHASLALYGDGYVEGAQTGLNEFF